MAGSARGASGQVGQPPTDANGDHSHGCDSDGQFDDARYAQQFTRSRSESRKQGPYRIARDLRARGVPDQHIEAALKDAAAQSDPAALIRHRIARKMKLLRGEIDERKVASLYRSLLAAGFPSDLIRKELYKLTHQEIPDSEAESE